MNNKFYASCVAGCTFLSLFFCQQTAMAQRQKTHWATDGYQYYRAKGDSILELDTRDPAKKSVLLDNKMLTPTGQKPITVANFYISDDGQKILIFTNTKKVWRYNT